MNRASSTADRTRVGARLFTSAGAALTVIGVLGLVVGVADLDWLLVTAAILAVGVGAFVLLAGLSLRQAVRQSERRLDGARVDAAAAATVAAAVPTRPTAPAAGPVATETCRDEVSCGVECTSACAMAGLRRH